MGASTSSLVNSPSGPCGVRSVKGGLRGVKVGRRVFFDDEVNIPERTLTTIGDDCVLNTGCDIQCHSQEDGTFKTDRSKLGAGCTVGIGATVHYGVTMRDGSELAPDSFLMKGEEVPLSRAGVATRPRSSKKMTNINLSDTLRANGRPAAKPAGATRGASLAQQGRRSWSPGR